jgi:hypothetical protein
VLNVFRGRLGNEADAKFLDFISLGTPMRIASFSFNNESMQRWLRHFLQIVKSMA